MTDFTKQVDKHHYRFAHYCDLQRFSSYWYQLNEVLNQEPQSLLEVGPGDHVFANYLKSNTEVSYTSVDFAEDLHPDVVADVRKLPFKDDEFDIVCAFEVLEHLPFEEFETALKELIRVSRKSVLLSLPHWGRSFAFSFQIPYLGKFSFNFKLPYSIFAIKHKWDREHYWEIGKKGYSLQAVQAKIEKSGGYLLREFVPTENTYHHFFVINKKSKYV